MIPFGPQLIGQTEKTLNALLTIALGGADISEQEWVTLRLADQNEHRRPLPEHVRDMTGIAGAETLVDGLTARGYLADGSPTELGRAFLDATGRRITTLTAPLWASLSDDDVAAATRVLNAVVLRGREIAAGATVPR